MRLSNSGGDLDGGVSTVGPSNIVNDMERDRRRAEDGLGNGLLNNLGQADGYANISSQFFQSQWCRTYSLRPK